MAGKPAETPPARHSGGGPEPEDETERTGPVVVARHVKDDGRALILYTRASRELP